LLVTSRYHAGVLSLPNHVPQTAIGHDLRIKDFYSDLDIPKLFVDHEDPNRYQALSDNIENIISHYSAIKSKLLKGYQRYIEQERRNPVLLRAFLEANYPEWLS
jgi:polysaccharide pyruvyl transferase WcaK-like protein